MGEVIELGNITFLDLPPDRVLQNHIGELDGVVIIGFDLEGGLVFASSYADGGTVMWLLEKAKQQLLAASEDM